MNKNLIAAALLAFAAPAVAENTPDRLVSYGDLDLSSVAGQAVLSARIESAVRAACGPVDSSYMLGISHRNQCRLKKLAAARSDMQRAIARYQGRADERLARR